MLIYVKLTIHTILIKQRQYAAFCHDLSKYNILFFSKIISAGHLAPQYGVTMTEQQRQYSDSRSSTVTDNGCNPLKPPPTTTHNRFILLFYALYISSTFHRQILTGRLDSWLFPRKSALFYCICYVGYQSKSKYNHIIICIRYV